MHCERLHLILVLLVNLVAISHSSSNQDNDLIESSGQTAETTFENEAKPLPEFMTGLFRCWNKRSNSAIYKACLESMGEGEKAPLIMNSNTVTAFIGVFAADDQQTNSPKHRTISFDISRIKPDENVVYSELRVFRRGMSIASIHSHSSNICNLSGGVNLTLLGEMSNGQMHVIDRQFINRKMLRRDEWLVFTNINSLLSDWIKPIDKNYSNVKRISLALQGGCASLHPEVIGIQEVPTRFPLLASFLQTSSSETQKMIESKSSSRTKRQTNTESTKEKEKNEACKLKYFKVKFADLGWDKLIIGPSSYSANICSGSCLYPLSSTQNGTLHSQIQSFYHLQQPSKVGQPCCTPTKMSPLSVIMSLKPRTVHIESLPDMIVTECGCR